MDDDLDQCAILLAAERRRIIVIRGWAILRSQRLAAETAPNIDGRLYLRRREERLR